MKTWFKMLLVSATLSVVAACGGDDDPANPLDVVQADSRFTVLREAVAAAELAPALSGSTPITLFAPTDDAFAALLTELGLSNTKLHSKI